MAAGYRWRGSIEVTNCKRRQNFNLTVDAAAAETKHIFPLYFAQGPQEWMHFSTLSIIILIKNVNSCHGDD